MSDDLAAFTDDGVLGKIRIRIYKSAKIAMIEGGDGGPGSLTSTDPVGVTWAWSLPLDKICANHPNINKTLVLNTLGNCMSVIGQGSIITCNSYSAAGSGNYIGTTPHSHNTEQIQLCGTQPYQSEDSGSFPNGGQLQIWGQGIDLSSANQKGTAEISALPVGLWIAQPVSNTTQRILGLFIED